MTRRWRSAARRRRRGDGDPARHRSHRRQRQVHAVMGPNGAGKSTLSGAIMGKPGYEVLGGSVTLDGLGPGGARESRDVLAMPVWEAPPPGCTWSCNTPPRSRAPPSTR